MLCANYDPIDCHMQFLYVIVQISPYFDWLTEIGMGDEVDYAVATKALLQSGEIFTPHDMFWRTARISLLVEHIERELTEAVLLKIMGVKEKPVC